jgi:hypothetical protein
VAFVVKKIGENGRSRTAFQNGRAPCCILLTATIAPPQTAVARNDPIVRLQDYLTALEFYLSLPTSIVDRILFVDNSASDLTPIERFVKERVADKVVELISFEGNDHPVSYGKAYGEFKLMDFGLTHTSLVASEDIFWKITGRLKFVNVCDMVSAVHDHYDLLCDLHNFPLVGTGKFFGNRWMDLRVFSCSVKAYKEIFAGKYEQFGPRLNQDTLYDVVMDASSYSKILPRFPIHATLSGFSGRHDRNYHSGMQKLKTCVRSVFRKVAPQLWV